MDQFSTTLRGLLTQEDKRRSDYAYVPFELPFEAARLEIRYRYSARMSSDEVEGGNVIDVGLFDPRGRDFPGGAGFRGWSGSARDGFYLTLEDATPGYLPGPLPAGRYEVILGLYRIWEQGAEYEVDVRAEALTRQASSPSSQAAERAGQGGGGGVEVHSERGAHEEQTPAWFRGDLQSHTYHSDAKGSPEQLVAKARSLGLDFLAITDHNTVSHHSFLAQIAQDELLLIPGQEVTTYYGHMNVWGTGRWCDFRAASSAEMAAIVEWAHSGGGVCSINHPKTGGPAWEFDTDLDVQAMEVWQGPWPYRNTESLALWDRLLCEGRRLPAVGGSDYHCPAQEDTNLLRLGRPTTWVHARSREVKDILAALCAGRCCVSAHAQGPRLDMVAHCGDDSAEMGGVLDTSSGHPISLRVQVWDAAGYRLRVIGDGQQAEEMSIDHNPTDIHFTVRATRYVRCEVVGAMDPEPLPPGVPANIDQRDWRWALSNPVYISDKPLS